MEGVALWGSSSHEGCGCAGKEARDKSVGFIAPAFWGHLEVPLGRGPWEGSGTWKGLEKQRLPRVRGKLRTRPCLVPSLQISLRLQSAGGSGIFLHASSLPGAVLGAFIMLMKVGIRELGFVLLGRPTQPPQFTLP